MARVSKREREGMRDNTLSKFTPKANYEINDNVNVQMKWQTFPLESCLQYIHLVSYPYRKNSYITVNCERWERGKGTMDYDTILQQHNFTPTTLISILRGRFAQSYTYAYAYIP